MQNEKLRELSETYGLSRKYSFVQKYGNKEVPFMLKSGIDKIQAIENIEFDFESIEPLCIPNQLVTLKCTARWGDRKPFNTIGEASKDNCRVSYLGCMAEKRGKGRAILTLTGFANEGVYVAEEKWEVETDELSRSK